MKKFYQSTAELWFRSMRILKSYGLIYFIRRLRKYLKRQGWRNIVAVGDLNVQYQKWLGKRLVENQSLVQNFGDVIKISIIMPVCNPDIKYLNEAVNSILSQNSPNWELCLVDDASTEPQVLEYLKKLAEQDKRISLICHDTTRGISDAINSALTIAQSEYVLLIDQDGILRPHAISSFQRFLNVDNTLDLIYADEDKLDDYSGTRIGPNFKPEWSPHLLHSYNYVGHPLVVRSKLVKQLGGLRKHFDGSQEHDLLLRLSDFLLKVKRIPDVLYSCRVIKDFSAGGQDETARAIEAGCLAIDESIQRKGYTTKVSFCSDTGIYNFRIGIKEQPKISIIIPTKNNEVILKRCLDSIQHKSSYNNYEILVIDNGSTDEPTIKYLDSLKDYKNVKILSYPWEFNYPLINNFGAANASGQHLVFLNDDTEIITHGWLEALLEYSQMPDVGAVGALLQFPNGMIQHAGIVIGMRGSASHAFYKSDPEAPSYLNLVRCIRNVSAVTAACLMIKAESFAKTEGFNPDFRLGLNDVDLCLRLLKMGLNNIYTPHAKLVHYESFTRGEYVVEKEIELFKSLYHEYISKGDPYYHPHLSLERNDFSLAV